LMIPENAETRTRRYRGVSHTRPIDAAKEAVRVIDLADRLCGPGSLRRIGKEWVGRCPLPDHEDRSPSFAVNLEKNAFFCHGCLRGGDVVELARLAWGYDQRDAHVAAANLLMEFDREVPRRPLGWFRKQERQKPVRDAIEEVKVRSARRRMMRTLLPLVGSIEDPQERRDEAQRIWQELEPVARLMVMGAS
jgi:hypothetical protein